MYIHILPPRIQCEPRSTLYFGQYEYVVTLPCKEAWLVRDLNRLVIEQKLVHRELYARDHDKNLNMPAVRQTVMCIVDTLEQLKSKFMHRSNGWQALHVYTNDLDDVKLLQTVFNDTATIKQAAVVYPSGVIMLSNTPKYPFRTYFRDKILPMAKRQALWTWISCQTPDLVASPATKIWFETNNRARSEWCRGHYFVEHTDLKHITMLAMVCPGLTRKTVQVQKRP